MEGLQVTAQGGGTISDAVLRNNVVVAPGPSLTMSYSIAVQGSSSTVTGVAVDDNYIDATGAYGAFYPPGGSGLSFVGNVNLATGKVWASPKGTSSSDVTAVVATPGSGAEVPGDAITLTLTLDQAMTVVGTPTLSLNDGGSAVYASGSGGRTLSFTTTVAAGDSDVAALAITGVGLAGGAAIADGAGNPANLAGALVSFSGLAIDATAPTVTAVLASPSLGTELPGATIGFTVEA